VNKYLNADQLEHLQLHLEQIGGEPMQPAPGACAELIALALDGFGPGVPLKAPPALPGADIPHAVRARRL
jgi:hypothetical protein